MNEQRAGLVYGFAAYGMWGLFPLYWPLLEPAGAMEILAHRMVWSLVVVAVILLVAARWAWIGELLASRAGWPCSRRGRRADLGELGHLHLRRELRRCGGDLARLLHQPAGHHRARRGRAARAAAAGAVGGGRHRRAGRRRAHRRLRTAAVDRPHPGLLLRHLRPGEEAGQHGRAGVAGRGDLGAVRARAGLPAGAPGARRLRPSPRHGPGHAALLVAAAWSRRCR